jgi:hypothetical protein
MLEGMAPVPLLDLITPEHEKSSESLGTFSGVPH